MEDHKLKPTYLDLRHSLEDVKNELYKSSPSLNVISANIELIHRIFSDHPHKTWPYIHAASLLERSYMGTDNFGSLKHPIQIERNQGSYGVTLAFLRLIYSASKWIKQWKRWDLDRDYKKRIRIDFQPYVTFIVNNIFYSYERWKYNKITEKWDIANLIINIFYEMLYDVPQTYSDNVSTMIIEDKDTTSVQDKLLELCLMDQNIVKRFLNIILVGPTLIENIKARTSKDGDLLESLVCRTFELLKTAMILKFKHNITTLTPLEECILKRREAKKDPIYIFTTYIQYKHSIQLPILATEFLSFLCKSIYDASSEKSLVSHFGIYSNDVKKMYLSVLKENKEDNADLMISILDFIVMAIRTQPQFSTLLLETSESDKDFNFTDIVLKYFESVQWNPDKGLKRFYSYMKVLLYLWKDTESNNFVLSKFRADSSFWKRMFECLKIKKEDLEEKPIDFIDWRKVAIKSIILEILSSEMFFIVSSDKLDSTFRDEMKSLRVTSEWIVYFSKLAFDVKLQQSLFLKAQQLSIDLSRLIAYSDDFILNEDYIYDIDITKKKLTNLLSHEKRKKEIQPFLDDLEKMNCNAVMSDNQVMALKSLKTFYLLVDLKYPEFTLTDENKMIESTIQLSDSIANEKREGHLATKKLFNMASIAYNIIHRWAIKQEEQSEEVIQKREKIVDNFVQSLTNFVASDVYAAKSIILSSIYLVIKTIKTWTPNMTKTCIMIMPIVAQVFSDLDDTDVMGSDEEAIQRLSVQKISLSVLQVIVARVNDPQVLFPALRNANLVASLMDQFNQCLQSQVHWDVTESILYFFITLAESHSSMSEMLAVEGLVVALRQDAFRNFITYALEESKEEYMPWLRIWCLCLMVLSRMVRSLGHMDHFVDQALDFVLTYQQRILSTLSYNAKAKLMDISTFIKKKDISCLSTVNGLVKHLDEVECLSLFLFELSHYNYRWRFILDTPHNPTLTTDIEVHILKLFSIIVDSRSSSVKIKISMEALTESLPNKRGLEILKERFKRVEGHLLQILRSLISIIRINTPKLYGDEQDTATLIPIFRPLQFNPTDSNPMPSLGHLTLALESCVTEIKRLDKSDKSAIALLEYIVDASTYIMTSHLIIFLLKGDEISKKRVRDEICNEYITFMTLFVAELKKKERDPKFLLEMEHFLKRIQYSARSHMPML